MRNPPTALYMFTDCHEKPPLVTMRPVYVVAEDRIKCLIFGKLYKKIICGYNKRVLYLLSHAWFRFYYILSQKGIRITALQTVIRHKHLSDMERNKSCPGLITLSFAAASYTLAFLFTRFLCMLGVSVTLLTFDRRNKYKKLPVSGMWDVGTAGMYFIMLPFDASVLICWPQFAPEQVMCLSKPRSPPSFHSNAIQNTLKFPRLGTDLLYITELRTT